VIARLSRFEELTLPKGERLLWQGRPEARALAVRVFHVRLVAAWFVLLSLTRIAMSASQHESWMTATASASRLVVPFAIAMVLLGSLGWVYSRTTRYSITNRRVLLQFGAVLPMTLNVPFAQVGSAAVKEYRDGNGDMPLAVIAEQRLAFLLLWPHVRPWRLNHVEPMLRCVPDARNVSGILAKALEAAAAPGPEPASSAMLAPRLVRLTSAIATAA
jgi:hypothetical protein